MARPRQFTPEESAQRNKDQKAQSAKRRAPVFNENRRERRFRHRDLDPRHQAHQFIAESMAVVSALGLHRPNLLWIDANGNVTEEKWESAEELIERIQKKEKQNNATKKRQPEISRSESP
jgi:hypothetical protein